MKTHSIEPLESRYVPAGVFTFTDVDGDLVKLTSSHGTDADLAAAAHVVGGQLRLLDLTAAVFTHTDVTASVVTKGAFGDGIVNIGRIDATNRDLGSVSVSGDLGNIDCGDATFSTTGLKSLSVRSMGVFGLATQGGTGDLESIVIGRLGTLTVRGDLHGATLFVAGVEDGILGSAFVGGSIVGGALPNSGQIQTTGNMGPVTIGGDIIGGTDSFSGAVFAGGKLASVTVGGSLVGGTVISSGTILGQKIGSVKIGGDIVGGSDFFTGSIQGANIGSVNVRGSLLGGVGHESGSILSRGDIGVVTVGENVKGNGEQSGNISALGAITSVRIGGSLIGGSTLGSGAIVSGGALGAVTILHDVKGGAGDESGKIDAGGKIGRVAIGGSVLGGSGHQDTKIVGALTHLGQIYSGATLGSVKIGGNVQGADGRMSASVVSVGSIARVSIGGSLLGGVGDLSANIETPGVAKIGPVSIRHDLRGGEGFGAGRVASGGDLVSVTIGGSIFGGTGDSSGLIGTEGSATAIVRVAHDVVGGSGEASGFIGQAVDVTIGGSLIGGTGHDSGGISTFGADLRSVRIGHDLLGGSIPGQHAALDHSGFIESDRAIRSITIGGSIVSGTDGSGGAEGLTFNASIRAGRDIGSLTVRGDIVGNVTPAGDSPVVISAFGKAPTVGATSDVAIGKISVGGRVEHSQILAGYDRNLVAKNADAQIGSVTVGADWIASTILAGAENLGRDHVAGGTGANADNVNFGNLDDRRITEAGELTNVVSRIGSIAIGGQVFGTPSSLTSGGQFGFVAEEIGAVKVGARTFVLNAGSEDDGFSINSRTDLGSGPNVHEIGSGFATPVIATDTAKLLNPTTVTYTDKDGDKITVTFTLPVLTAGNVNDVFHFDTGVVNDGVNAAQQLRFLDLRPLASNGVGVAFTVVRGAHGDGLVHVGAIESTGFDVGTVTLPGDLGHINAGDDNFQTVGLASLNVRTLGRHGLDTQGPQSIVFLPSLESDIAGGIGALNVRQDMVNALVDVDGSIGSVKIGGSLIGGADDNSGVVRAGINIGTIEIGHHLQGGFGGRSGSIAALGDIVSAKIGGSVLGAGGGVSGTILGGLTGFLQVGHNVRGGTNGSSAVIGVEDGATVTIGGSLIGGSGEFSARISSDTVIGAVKVGHNVIGGAERSARFEAERIVSINIGGSLIGGDANSGSISARETIDRVTIAHDVQGGRGLDSGKIAADGAVFTARIGGSLVGGVGNNGGQVESGFGTGIVRIGGDVLGGSGTKSGIVVSSGQIDSVTVHGSVVGGSGIHSGGIIAGGRIGTVAIGGNILGGDVSSTGYVSSGGDLTSLTIGGSVVASSRNATGFIQADGQAGVVKIGGDLIGSDAVGAGGSSGGSIDVGEKLKSLSIEGSLVGGTRTATGRIFADEIGTVKIGRNILGGSVAGLTGTLDQSGYVESAHRIASITVGGSLFAGLDTSTAGSLTKNASIRANREIGSLVIKGSLHGHSTSQGLSAVVISARGQPVSVRDPNVAIGSLRVGRSVDHGNIFGGYGIDLTPGTTVAQIGSVSVGRDWIASNLVCGVVNLGADDTLGGTGANADNVSFGDAHDTFIGPGNNTNRIAKIVIGGLVTGTDASGDHFGFSSVNIDSFKSLNFTAPVTAAKIILDLSPATGDVTLRES